LISLPLPFVAFTFGAFCACVASAATCVADDDHSDDGTSSSSAMARAKGELRFGAEDRKARCMLSVKSPNENLLCFEFAIRRGADSE
jgi:hypothetical protein